MLEKDLSGTVFLVIYLDGIQFGKHHVLCAVGVDPQGYKHVLGLSAGASENATVVKDLLEHLVQRGLDPQQRRLFVIDGAKALRAGIDAVFGTGNPVQRCRNHKLRNVLDHLPKDLHAQTKAALRAAFKREGLSEMFTLNRLGLPPSLCRCLATTNLVDTSHSGVREKTRRVTHWQDENMALRWAGGALLATAEKFRRIMGYQQLWMLEAHLKEAATSAEVVTSRKTG